MVEKPDILCQTLHQLLAARLRRPCLTLALGLGGWILLPALVLLLN
ncbi:MAG: hypothetical protein PW790_02485 [Parvibaculaceae bacterium]|nr:hypothetical protein [Parvibaculaceae bacterium]